jgi:hypothetical protein
LAAGIALAIGVGEARAQFFNLPPVRPPADIPQQTPQTPPAPQLAAPETGAPAVAPRGPTLQSLPPVTTPTPPPARSTTPGQAQLALSARFGPNMPQINAGLHWRIYHAKPEGGAFRPVKEDKGANPTFALPPGNYVVHVAFGLASATRTIQVRADGTREIFEIAAGGLRIQGRVGDVRISRGQNSFDLFPGSQFEPGDRRAIAQSVAAGDVVLVPEGSYHIVSHYGDANSVVRSDIRIQTGKLVDAIVTHRAAVITLKLVNQYGGEARANTQWSVFTPGGDVVKEVTGAFPRIILAEGEYRAVARSDDRTFERQFRVVTGVDGEVEVLAR